MRHFPCPEWLSATWMKDVESRPFLYSSWNQSSYPSIQPAVACQLPGFDSLFAWLWWHFCGSMIWVCATLFRIRVDDLSRSASYSRTRLIPTKPSNNNWWWDEAACRDWTRKEEVRQLAFSDTSWHISWWLVSQIVICTGTIDMNSHRAVPHPHKLGRRFNESFGQ